MERGNEQEVREQLREISPEGLFHLGTPDIVYARPINTGSGIVFSLHSANGAQVAVLETHDEIEAAARYHEMTLVSVH